MVEKLKISQSGLIWIWGAILVIVLDQFTKGLAIQYLIPYDPVSVMPFFNFTLAFNTGAAFNFLSSQSGWQRWFFVLIAVAVSIFLTLWLYRTPRQHYRLNIALALILGGALGNVWDRLSVGYVIDFLDFYIGNWHWPAFNLADTAICVGAFLLILDMFFHKSSEVNDI